MDKPIEYICPECGENFGSSRGAAGLRSWHRKTRHGVRSQADKRRARIRARSR